VQRDFGRTGRLVAVGGQQRVELAAPVGAHVLGVAQQVVTLALEDCLVLELNPAEESA
jgi:hypothetical protein